MCWTVFTASVYISQGPSPIKTLRVFIINKVLIRDSCISSYAFQAKFEQNRKCRKWAPFQSTHGFKCSIETYRNIGTRDSLNANIGFKSSISSYTLERIPSQWLFCFSKLWSNEIPLPRTRSLGRYEGLTKTSTTKSYWPKRPDLQWDDNTS